MLATLTQERSEHGGKPTMTEQQEAAGGWARTLAAADEMAETLREDGWETVTVRAGHVAPELPSDGATDRLGFVYIAQGSDADDLRDALEDGEFDGYEVFNRRVGSDLFMLTRVTDSDRRRAVLLVGTVDLSDADELVTLARERDELHSHVQLLDGTPIGTFQHRNPDAFFPEEL